ncbi:sphingomyelin phosphodiesterase-like [Sabethes cyaneus]|uniref:sphingomyelin phosphodiesterase-like n=1 Tax=Sabethes cyaneus TaxID=53552 RepID=UPI00237DB44D|nr:sphingomyelin phosphodiesterase-like [Sabethes cyaneus]
MYTLITSYKSTLASKSSQVTTETLRKVAQGLCMVAKLENEYCKKLVDIYLPTIAQVLQKNCNITPNQICSMVFSPIQCVEQHSAELSPKPVVLSDRPTKLPIAKHSSNLPPIKILHITDIHYDPEYKQGVESLEVAKRCKNTFGCCRTAPSAGATENYWGNYHFCDTPKHLLETTLKQIAAKHPDINLIYLTGDLLRHHITEIDFETLKRDSSYVLDLFISTFRNVPILFAYGNHDTNVFGAFSSALVNTKDGGQANVYSFYQQWIKELWNNGKLIDNLKIPPKTEGYYTVKFTGKFRVIVLNSNIAYIYNWWMLVEHFYAAELQWLQNVLARAESRQERVHILSHIPPNHPTLLHGWSREYQRIVERYSGTIVAQFNGHSHFDEFAMFYDSRDLSKPISVAWNGGALTPHVYNNPNYHIITLDPKNLGVSQLESYYLNLAEANENPRRDLNWKLLFNMTDTYGLENLSLESLDRFVQCLAADESVSQQYWANKVKKSPRVKRPLTAECRAALICDIVTTDVRNSSKCEELAGKYRSGWGSANVKLCPMDGM